MRLMLLFQIIMLVPSICISSDIDYCASAAMTLSYAASEYNNQIEIYNRSCNPYIGYLKDDSGACGSVGYMKSAVTFAQIDFESAYNSVVYACSGEADAIQQKQKEIHEAVKKFKKMKDANPPEK